MNESCDKMVVLTESRGRLPNSSCLCHRRIPGVNKLEIYWLTEPWEKKKDVQK